MELGLQEELERERVGYAFPIGSRAYQRRYLEGSLASKSLVYVAGCGRSGTTLLQRLMRCFQDTHVAQGERPFTAFLDLAHRMESGLVVKRDANAWQSLPWMPIGVKVIYCVRHPYDVLTSYHPGAKRKGYYIKPARWRAEYLALKKLLAAHGSQTLIVRYEDLIQDGDRTQDRIKAFTGLREQHSFSDIGETLSSRSIGKWIDNRKFIEHLSRVRNRHGSLIDKFLTAFGYEG